MTGGGGKKLQRNINESGVMRISAANAAVGVHSFTGTSASKQSRLLMRGCAMVRWWGRASTKPPNIPYRAQDWTSNTEVNSLRHTQPGLLSMKRGACRVVASCIVQAPRPIESAYLTYMHPHARRNKFKSLESTFAPKKYAKRRGDIRVLRHAERQQRARQGPRRLRAACVIITCTSHTHTWTARPWCP